MRCKSISKPSILLLFGGRSAEHAISIRSAVNVCGFIDSQQFDVYPFYLAADGRVFPFWPADLPENLESLPSVSQAQLFQDDWDIVLPILHGPFGEDGTIQGLLDFFGIPYVGAGVLSSSVCMDKAVFKMLMVAEKISIAPWRYIDFGRTSSEDARRLIDEAGIQLGYPLMTKPANLGSSIGINWCSTPSELGEGIEEARRYDKRVVIEKALDVRELEVAVIGHKCPRASVVGEIIPSSKFYDYQEKYGDTDAKLIIPADLSESTAETARNLALRVYRAVNCKGLARVDLFLLASGELLVNEVNTMPGFTDASAFPLLWKASGLETHDLITELINEELRSASGEVIGQADEPTDRDVT